MGKKIRLTALFLTLALLLCIAGCGEDTPTEQQDTQKTTVDLYYLQEDGNQLASEQREITYNEQKELPQLVLEELLKGPSTPGLKRLIPEETILLGCSFSGEDTVVVNFSTEYSNISSVDEVMARYSVTQTVCSLPGISKVILLVDGKNLVDGEGQQIGALSKDNIVLDRTEAARSDTVYTLYFSDRQAQYLVPESRTVSASESDTAAKTVLTELMKGPDDTQSLVPTIPQGVRLLSVDVKDGTCFVNFSQDFITKHSGGSAGEEMTVYSIVNTLTELPDIQKVEFLIEGKRQDVFISMIFNEPFVRNESLIRS